MKNDLKIIFASSDSIALPVLEEVNKNFNIVGVLTSSCNQTGRKKTANVILEYAKNYNISYITPEHLLQDERDWIKGKDANFLLSFSYSRIFGPKFLSLFSKGTMNIHPSSLPLYRGPSPLQTLLLNQDKKSAISFQTIALRMDEGDIYYKADYDIDENDDILTLRNKVSHLAASVIKDVIENHLESPKAQEGVATYTKIFSSLDGKIDWDNDTAKSISSMTKAFAIWPRTYCIYQDKKLFFERCNIEQSGANHNAKNGEICAYDKEKKVFLVNTKEGILELEQLMLEGKKSQSAEDFRNGHREFVGAILK